MNTIIDYLKYPVLFVDDDESNRVIFQANFGDDFNIILAKDGHEALKLLYDISPAVLVTDQRMPGMTGVELAEIVRRDKPEVVRMIITAYADIQAAIDAINRGQVLRYISKPWNVPEVRAYLRNSIELYHLNNRVQELQAQVLRTERMVTLGLAATSIAHDMGSPVSCLLNDLDGVEQDLVQVKEEVLVQRLTPIAGRLDEILEVLKDCKGSVEEISRILIAVRGSIRSKPKWEMVPLSTVVSTALRLIQTEVVHKATLKVECDPHVVVEGDAAELTQVVINLLVNAANAITSGKQSENCVDLVVESKEQMAILHVRDSGCGIPPEIRDKIFEPLFTTRQREGGTGLGLSIIKRIVDNHRGSITVDSTVGKGTLFTILFPLFDQSQPEIHQPNSD